jgi:hypothetical protein
MATVGQTTYSRSFGNAFSGQIADGAINKISSFLNKSGGTLAAGKAVKVSSADGTETSNLALTTDQIAGITVLTFATDPNNLAGTATYAEGVSMDVLEEGEIYVATENTVAVTDAVYVRFAANGANTVIGSFTSAPDAGTRVVKGGRWKSVTVNGTARLYFSAAADQAVH